MSLTPEQEQAVRFTSNSDLIVQVRDAYRTDEAGMPLLIQRLIEQLSQTQSALEQAQRELSQAHTLIGSLKAEVLNGDVALQQVQRERDQAEKLAEEYRLRLPTTAQAIVYQSLLNKYEALEKERDELQAKLLASEAAGAEMRDKLELARHHFIRTNAGNLDQLASMPTPYDVTNNCGTGFLVERERHVKALEEIIGKLGGLSVGPGPAACRIAREALKETK